MTGSARHATHDIVRTRHMTDTDEGETMTTSEGETMNEFTIVCECGARFTPDENGRANTVWNGMHDMELCDECWLHPETIATEVCVLVAENIVVHGRGIDPFPRFADFVGDDATMFADRFATALEVRKMTDDDGAIRSLVGARWDEWF